MLVPGCVTRQVTQPRKSLISGPCRPGLKYLTSNRPGERIDLRRAVYLGDPDVVLVGHRHVGRSGAPRPNPVGGDSI